MKRASLRRIRLASATGYKLQGSRAIHRSRDVLTSGTRKEFHLWSGGASFLAALLATAHRNPLCAEGLQSYIKTFGLAQCATHVRISRLGA